MFCSFLSLFLSLPSFLMKSLLSHNESTISKYMYTSFDFSRSCQVSLVSRPASYDSVLVSSGQTVCQKTRQERERVVGIPFSCMLLSYHKTPAHKHYQDFPPITFYLLLFSLKHHPLPPHHHLSTHLSMYIMTSLIIFALSFLLFFSFRCNVNGKHL